MAVEVIGILTGGPSCPGLNAAIRSVVRHAERVAPAVRVLGFRDGWRGLLENEVMPLDRHRCAGILRKGGSLLGTSAVNPFTIPRGVERLRATMAEHAVDSLIVMGDADTLAAAQRLAESGIRVVAIPQAIGTDVGCTDFALGFDSAVNVAMASIDRLHESSDSTPRIMVVEVTGSQSGWIALHAGLGGGADFILVPERKVPFPRLCEALRARREAGKALTILVVAEGARLEGLEGSERLEERETVVPLLVRVLEGRSDLDVRSVTVSHVQRGGEPTAFDRYLATAFGATALEAAVAGESGRMVAAEGRRIVKVDLGMAVQNYKGVDDEVLDLCDSFFG